jgi:hypothetical protein
VISAAKRYALGFKPEALDGKHHKLRVKLADAVKNQHNFQLKAG